MPNIFNNSVNNITVAEDAVSVYTANVNGTIITQLDICNTSNVVITASITILRSPTSYYLGKDLEIPIGSTLQYIAGQKIVLLDGDVLKVEIENAGGTASVIIASLDDINS